VVLGWGGGTGHAQSAKFVLRGDDKEGAQFSQGGAIFVPPRRAARNSHEGAHFCTPFGSEEWEVGSGKWEVGSGKWEVGSRKAHRGTV